MCILSLVQGSSVVKSLMLSLYLLVCLQWIRSLPHWGQEKMDSIFQMAFSNAFSWMKIYKFWLKFLRIWFLMVQLTIYSIGSDNGLVPARRQAIVWTNYGQFIDGLYVSLGPIELICSGLHIPYCLVICGKTVSQASGLDFGKLLF